MISKARGGVGSALPRWFDLLWRHVGGAGWGAERMLMACCDFFINPLKITSAKLPLPRANNKSILFPGKPFTLSSAALLNSAEFVQFGLFVFVFLEGS